MSNTLTLQLVREGQPLEPLEIRRLSGHEAISECFNFELEMVCARSTDVGKLLDLGSSLCLVFLEDGLPVRRVHGVVQRLENDLACTEEFDTYRLSIVPRLQRLMLTNFPSVYVDATLLDVLENELPLIDLAKGTDFFFNLVDEKLPSQAIFVQHSETDFAFISRLTEHFGVSFLFEQTEDREQVYFTDKVFPPCEGVAETIAFNATGTTHGVYALTASQHTVPEIYKVADYNYRKPSRDELDADYVVKGDDKARLGAFAGNRVETAGNTMTKEEAEKLAQVRAEEQLALQLRFHGKSTRPEFSAGHRTVLTDHPRLRGESGTELLLVKVVHRATLPTRWETTRESHYENEFVAVPTSRAFRPERKTPRPRIPGVVTGTIEPQNGGSLAVLDERGRYEVRFHFDLEKGLIRKRWTTPLRMAQPFEGGAHGMHFPLRPGTEVLIAFENGDPDRPVILGAVPNETQPSPVNNNNANLHRVVSPDGLVIEFGASARPTMNSRS
jgi:type VI secretion system secreted protein VgrG